MGVAHEVDNHLSVIMGFSELLQLPGAEGKRAAESAAKIFAAGEKVGTIMRHFAYYVRPHEPAPEPFFPSDLLKEILPFSRYDLNRGGITLCAAEKVPSGIIVADRRDLALALLALLFNGSEAMQGRGGTLRLDVALRDGEWEFSVADEGPGIAEDVMPRIFEEGFTTRTAPYHRGMGLPVARHIVAGMGGDVAVVNMPAGGCLATVRVPGKAS